MTPLISRLTEWRRHFPQLQGRTWLGGHRPDGTYDVLWLTSDAVEMTEQDWRVSNGHFLSYVLAAAEHGQPPVFLALNASDRFHAANNSRVHRLAESSRHVGRNGWERSCPRGLPSARTCTVGPGLQRRRAAGLVIFASRRASDTSSSSTGPCRLTSNRAAVSLTWASVGRLASLPRC
jgi:hypothetical protein